MKIAYHEVILIVYFGDLKSLTGEQAVIKDFWYENGEFYPESTSYKADLCITGVATYKSTYRLKRYRCIMCIVTKWLKP